MAFKLPDLPYDYQALAEVIDEQTMRIHHQKHHGGYVAKLNTALEGHEELETKSLEDLLSDIDSLPMEIATAVRNNGGGHANHSLFWEVLSPEGGKPTGKLSGAIDQEWGSLEKFKEEFGKEALGRFGSGWAWLTVEEGKLHVCSTPNQDTPLMQGNIPVLGLDVWEHSYYLKYQNERAKYVEAFWKIVNWQEVGRRFEEAIERG